MAKAKKKKATLGTVLVLQSYGQSPSEYDFIREWINSNNYEYQEFVWDTTVEPKIVKQRLKDFIGSIQETDITLPYYILSYGYGCLLVKNFLKLFKHEVKTIFFLSPRELKRYPKISSLIKTSNIPIIIFSSNRETMEQQSKISSYININRLVYNLVIMDSNVNMLTETDFIKEQLFAGLKSYFEPSSLPIKCQKIAG